MERQKIPKSSESEVTIDHLLAAAYKLSDWANFYWRFYVVFIAVALGWIFKFNSDWDTTQKIVVTVISVGFVVFSICALRKTYDALNQAITLIEERWEHERFFKNVLVSLKPKLWGLEIASHLIADAILIYCIWSDKILRLWGYFVGC